MKNIMIRFSKVTRGPPAICGLRSEMQPMYTHLFQASMLVTLI